MFVRYFLVAGLAVTGLLTIWTAAPRTQETPPAPGKVQPPHSVPRPVLSFLAKHKRTRLVTIMLGANDLFLLEEACAGDQTCIANGLPQVLATISANMATILGEIRASGYKGLIVVENYYSLDYSDAAGTTLTQLLNQAVSAPAASFGAVVADVFSAFEIAATNPFAGGNTCKAGLLNASPQNQFLCDVHPSQSGQRLIARAVEAAFTAALQAAE